MNSLRTLLLLSVSCVHAPLLAMDTDTQAQGPEQIQHLEDMHDYFQTQKNHLLRLRDLADELYLAYADHSKQDTYNCLILSIQEAQASCTHKGMPLLGNTLRVDLNAEKTHWISAALTPPMQELTFPQWAPCSEQTVEMRNELFIALEKAQKECEDLWNQEGSYQLIVDSRLTLLKKSQGYVSEREYMQEDPQCKTWLDRAQRMEDLAHKLEMKLWSNPEILWPTTSFQTVAKKLEFYIGFTQTREQTLEVCIEFFHDIINLKIRHADLIQGQVSSWEEKQMCEITFSSIVEAYKDGLNLETYAGEYLFGCYITEIPLDTDPEHTHKLPTIDLFIDSDLAPVIDFHDPTPSLGHFSLAQTHAALWKLYRLQAQTHYDTMRLRLALAQLKYNALDLNACLPSRSYSF